MNETRGAIFVGQALPDNEPVSACQASLTY